MRALWLFAKWLLVPAVLAALGYFVLGPKLGEVPAIVNAVDNVGKQPQSTTEEDSTPGKKHVGEPQVIVERKPGGTFVPNRHRSRDGSRYLGDGMHKKRKRKRSTSSAPLGPEIPPPDSSGGGGGDTGGSTGGDTGGSTGGIG